MAKAQGERIEVAGREVVVTNPDKVLFPKPGYTKRDLVLYYMTVAEGALRGAGGRPNMLVRYPNGIGEEFFYQKRAPASRPEWIDVVTLRFPSGRSAEEVVPRWTFDQVRRCALALAREVERRAPKLVTTQWWKEERHGVFVDYNQNAKDRTIASAYSVRPTEEATVSAPLAWKEVETADPHEFTLATLAKRYKKVGDCHANIDARAFSLEALLELSKHQEGAGQGDAPWPPHYRKQAGERSRKKQ